MYSTKKTGFQFESPPSITTLWLLSVSHCSIQFITLINISWDFNVGLCEVLSGNQSRL